MNSKIAFFLIFLFIFFLIGKTSANEEFETAQRLFNMKKYNKAISLLKKATKINTASTEAWILLGDCYSEIEKYTQAINSYQQVLLVNSDHTKAILKIGISYSNMKHHNAAIEVYKKVLKINPNHKMAHFCLGISYDSIGSISFAFKHYKILKTLDKELAEKLYNIIFLE